MKNKGIAVLSAVVITVGTIAGVVFADNVNTSAMNERQQVITNRDNRVNIVRNVNNNEQTQTPYGDNNRDGFYGGCYSSNGANTGMINSMRENGFGDAAEYMQSGDYAKMNEFMNNLSEENYQKMIDIMRENGYASMAQMMGSIGREGMIRMHNSMYRSSGGYGMMGGF